MDPFYASGPAPTRTPMERAQEHHLNACLDNHTEDNCAAIQLAKELGRAWDEGYGTGQMDPGDGPFTPNPYAEEV